MKRCFAIECVMLVLVVSNNLIAANRKGKGKSWAILILFGFKLCVNGG